MFPSRKGENPISRVQAYRQLIKAGDVAELQMIFNHSHPKVTLTYIGILEEEVENNLKSFML